MAQQDVKRVLHVLGTLNMGGAESRTMDLYRHIDRDRLQFDFLVHTPAGKGMPTDSESLMKARTPQFFDEEVRALGGRIYSLPRFTGTNYFAYRRAAEDFFRTHGDWIAVEGHMTSMASVYLPAAARCSKVTPVTIAHARSAGTDRGLRGLATRLMRLTLSEKAQILLTCSREAGVAVFGQKAMDGGRVRMVPNAVDAGLYAYDPAVRARVRGELSIPENRCVLGHVGRFDEMKNQQFLIGLLDILLKEQPGAYCLLFVGTGKLQEQIRREAENRGISDFVLFAGQCPPERTRALYQAMDLFVFPSLYEGLPGTVVEAQAAGLPCRIADTITQEVCLTDLVRRLPLTAEEQWLSEIRAARALLFDPAAQTDAVRPARSQDALARLGEAGYDIVTQAGVMQDWYLGLENGI